MHGIPRTLAWMAAVSLALVTSAHASGVNIRWSNCFGEGTGTLNRNFACDTNTGSNTMVCSFVMDSDLPQVSGLELWIDLVSQNPTLDAWWQFKNAGVCRQSSLTVAGTPDPANLVCRDWGGGLQTTALAAYPVGAAIPGNPTATPNRASILAVAAVRPADLVDLLGHQEYFAFNIVIDDSKTLGVGSCAGCADPVCLVLTRIKVTTPCGDACNRELTGATNGTDSNFCTWQGGGNPSSNKGIGCPGATPGKNHTWGELKSLYRN